MLSQFGGAGRNGAHQIAAWMHNLPYTFDPTA
jgi:hypothetical protein